MAKRRITIDSDVLAELGRAVRRWRHENPDGETPSIFAHDPGHGGSRPTGWWLIQSDGSQLGGEGEKDDVIAEAGAALEIAGRPAIYVRENAYTLSRRTMVDEEGGERGISPVVLYKMGCNAGYVTGGLGRRLRGAGFWEPMPSSWRAVLGLNRRKGGDFDTDRDATADAVWLWARVTSGLPLLTPHGRRRVDMAMACGMAHAALSLAREAERSVS